MQFCDYKVELLVNPAESVDETETNWLSKGFDDNGFDIRS